jgi:dTDP-4-dehydrorhamnose 3,5-epimerase
MLVEKPRLNLDEIIKSARGSLSRQNYSAKKAIEGVRLVPLHPAVDDGGMFTELARLEGGRLAGMDDFTVRQVNYSLMAPGTIKAWHLHLNQEDVWFVPPSFALVVGLWDVRGSSPTAGLTMRLVLGRGRSQLLYIPRGVAHGAANLSTSDAFLIYFVNQQFDPQEPDEYRLPYDAVGADFWQVRPG